MLGISSVAPAYALTATIGLVVAAAGVKMPIIFIAGFLPMFFAAYAYREFNKVDPDCGTSFTWTTRAFGPYVGWIGGWVAVIATIIVLANLAGIGVQFFYQLLPAVHGGHHIGSGPDLPRVWHHDSAGRDRVRVRLGTGVFAGIAILIVGLAISLLPARRPAAVAELAA